MKTKKKAGKKPVAKKARKKRALITGITGQDGSYLAEFLVEKGYEVYGLMRRVSTDPLMRIEELSLGKKIKLIYGDLRDLSAVIRAIEESNPDEIYNLAAQSHVAVSFKVPEETLEINYFGLGRLVNKAMSHNKNVRIYQASTSEMFGSTKPPQNEQSTFRPQSPYAEAKLKAHEDFVVGYREKHGLFICSGILFNHESPRRGKHFVTRKITHSMAKIKAGLQDHMELGNLDAKRDWGYAKEYVELMWVILQQDAPQDFVISTGESHTVREFVEETAKVLGIKLTWKGKGVKEVAMDDKGKVILKVNKNYYRPSEVNYLLGDSSHAFKVLNWKPKVAFHELVRIMAEADLASISYKER